MATIKTNWMIASITSIIVLFSGFAVSANNSEKPKEETKKEVVSNRYHFTGTQLSQATNPAAWSSDPADAQNCDNIEELPCSVELEGTIESYLENKTPNDIMNDPSVSKRSQ